MDHKEKSKNTDTSNFHKLVWKESEGGKHTHAIVDRKRMPFPASESSGKGHKSNSEDTSHTQKTKNNSVQLFEC